MAEYTVAFEKDSNVWKLYQALKKAGVKDSELDRGYSEADYINKKRNQYGKNDRVIQAEEVLDYALERYERFHLALKEHMGYVIPWSLDDFDPTTTFDQEVRDKLQTKIKYIKEELKKAGYLNTSSDEYKELLAISVFTYVVAGKRDEKGVRVLGDNIDELRKAKLNAIVKMILKEGGFGLADINGDCDPEATALEALKKRCGMCTEFSYITYAALKMAGIETYSQYVEAPREYLIRKGWPPDAAHGSLVLVLNNKKRILDPGLGRANAEPHYHQNGFKWIQESRREWLGFYYALYASQVKQRVDDKALLELYRKARELNTNFYLINVSLGISYSKAGRIKEAIECYKKALSLQPNSIEAMSMLASAYTENKQHNEAVALFEKILVVEPKNLSALRYLVSNYISMHNYDKALEHGRKIAALNPKDLEVRQTIGQLYGEKKDYDKAVDEFKKILKDDPRYLPVYNSLAIVLYNQARSLMIENKYKESYAKLGEAKAVLQEYLKIKPGDERAQIILQQIEAVQKQLEKRIKD